jgi:hypothetical protein
MSVQIAAKLPPVNQYINTRPQYHYHIPGPVLHIMLVPLISFFAKILILTNFVNRGMLSHRASTYLRNPFISSIE